MIVRADRRRSKQATGWSSIRPIGVALKAARKAASLRRWREGQAASSARRTVGRSRCGAPRHGRPRPDPDPANRVWRTHDPGSRTALHDRLPRLTAPVREQLVDIHVIAHAGGAVESNRRNGRLVEQPGMCDSQSAGRGATEHSTQPEPDNCICRRAIGRLGNTAVPGSRCAARPAGIAVCWPSSLLDQLRREAVAQHLPNCKGVHVR